MGALPSFLANHLPSRNPCYLRCCSQLTSLEVLKLALDEQAEARERAEETVQATRGAMDSVRREGETRTAAEAAARAAAETQAEQELSARQETELRATAEATARIEAERHANAEAAARQEAERRMSAAIAATEAAERRVQAEALARQDSERRADAEAAARLKAERNADEQKALLAHVQEAEAALRADYEAQRISQTDTREMEVSKRESLVAEQEASVTAREVDLITREEALSMREEAALRAEHEAQRMSQMGARVIEVSRQEQVPALHGGDELRSQHRRHRCALGIQEEALEEHRTCDAEKLAGGGTPRNPATEELGATSSSGAAGAPDQSIGLSQSDAAAKAMASKRPPRIDSAPSTSSNPSAQRRQLPAAAVLTPSNNCLSASSDLQPKLTLQLRHDFAATFRHFAEAPDQAITAHVENARVLFEALGCVDEEGNAVLALADQVPRSLSVIELLASALKATSGPTVIPSLRSAVETLMKKAEASKPCELVAYCRQFLRSLTTFE